MHILVAGASGFIGTALVKVLQNQYQVTVLGRDKKELIQKFPLPIHHLSWDDLKTTSPKDYDVIINLAGQNIGASRWNAKIKQNIIDSRVKTSEALVHWVLKHEAKSRIFCANAIGIYGLQEDNDPEAFSEYSNLPTPPQDFLAEVGQKWQTALHPAIEAGVSVTNLRFGVVLKRDEGMLKKLYPSFFLGLGSIVGTGQQVISWIHIDDLVQAIIFLIQNPNLTGPFNLTSPYPVTQAEFARIFSAVLHRPLWLKTPAFVIRMLFGEMGDTLVLKGTRVLPKRLLDLGFKFKFPDLKEALENEYASTC